MTWLPLRFVAAEPRSAAGDSFVGGEHACVLFVLELGRLRRLRFCSSFHAASTASTHRMLDASSFSERLLRHTHSGTRAPFGRLTCTTYFWPSSARRQSAAAAVCMAS